MPKVLVIEDEKNFGIILRDYLRMNGFDTELSADGEEGLTRLLGNDFDLCILDIMMPRKDGFSVARALRSAGNNIPIIFLTARGMKDDMVRGYQLGCDDYIVKPFDSELLLLKVNAVLKRSEVKQLNQVFTFGKFTFDAAMRSLRSPDENIRLSPKESALLHLLCLHRDSVMPREKALREIWKDESYFTARSMDVYIAKLRKHLAPDPDVRISSLHGNGYALLTKKTVNQPD